MMLFPNVLAREQQEQADALKHPYYYYHPIAFKRSFVLIDEAMLSFIGIFIGFSFVFH